MNTNLMNTSDIEQRIVALETTKRDNRARRDRIHRQLRVLWAVGAVGTTFIVAVGANRDALAQGYTITLAQAATRIAALETKTASISAVTDSNTGKPTVRFTGVNVQIVSGVDTTDAVLNGVGNLIIGYNETGRAALNANDFDVRVGSHNLVLGTLNNYASYGSLVAGSVNKVNTQIVAFAHANYAYSNFSTIVGGDSNRSDGPSVAEGHGAAVSGGKSNKVIPADSNISGGNGNNVYGNNNFITGTVSGGQNNAAFASNSISGGGSNYAGGDRFGGNGGQSTAVSGGYSNIADGYASSVSGGGDNRATGSYISTTGGCLNTGEDDNAVLSGGYDSLIDDYRGTSAQAISGGFNARDAPVEGVLNAPYRWRAGRLYTNF